MTQVDIEEMGPIDYIVLEWPGRQPKGDGRSTDHRSRRPRDHPRARRRADGQGRRRHRRGDRLRRGRGGRRASRSSPAPRAGCSRGGPRGGGRGARARDLRGRARLGEPAGRRPSRSRCGSPAASSWPAAGSRSRPCSPRSRPPRPRPRPSAELGVSTMPGLLRGVARTAAIAGTATAVSNRVSRRQANRWAQQGQDPNAQQAPPPQQQVVYAEPRAGGRSDRAAQEARRAA